MHPHRPQPRRYPGVVVSSTFEDLEEHRAALMRAIEGQHLHPVAMEQDAALPAGTVVEASLSKVRHAAAYVGVISHRYGQVPECHENPDRLSLTELEFREARRLGLPILVFIMGPAHPVVAGAVEVDPDKRRKLEAFREEAKRASAGGSVHRVYRVFNDLADFSAAATQSVAELRWHLTSAPAQDVDLDVPAPPALYAHPSYIGSHTFVGRQAQLATLNDWADAADQHPVLLFESIGGAGKSMLSWQWITRHAPAVRGDWAGRFWYSFYEKGAVMDDFCRRALAYTTMRPVGEFAMKGSAEVAELLVRQLKRHPWLFVLDGLERVLAAYHHYDASQLLDDRAGESDDITDRDPCGAIRVEDEDLLRQLAGAEPSKILITSRLVPSVLLNTSNHPIPGVLHERLPGLRPADAEALLRSCNVAGDSAAIRAYLKRHCDCHPLVTGVVAGLVNGYLPARGDFDAWAADPHHGGHLKLSELDLVGKRNHILRAALAALPEPSWQLLNTLALLSETVDYETLSAFNPHLPLDRPAEPEEQAAALHKLSATVHDLEHRGLLQYDRRTQRYDIHPVVRGVTAGGLLKEDVHRIGQRMVDHFSARWENPHVEPESVEDLRHGMTLVRTLVQLGRIHEAGLRYTELGGALVHKLEAFPEVLSLLQPFFTHGWSAPHRDLITEQAASLATDAACALTRVGELERALALHGLALTKNIDSGNSVRAVVNLANAATTLDGLNRLARADRVVRLALELAELYPNGRALFVARLTTFERLVDAGQEAEAEKIWASLDFLHSWDYAARRSGQAEIVNAYFKLRTGRLSDSELTSIEDHARATNSKALQRKVHRLRGNLFLQLEDWGAAAHELGEAMRMARTSDIHDTDTATKLVLARLHSGQSSNAAAEAARLSSGDRPAHAPLALLWRALGEYEKALAQAELAYRRAWADGEPHVRRYDLREASLLLHDLGAAQPRLAPYDPASDPPLPWEVKVLKEVRNRRDARRST
ncbi:DUF4062 domain-containing protein [Lentzea nigeriaca]|uniref:DUF4062 domain-containing protein n=1 Tax=Lentzea nigeriaca TaxID=1128665 RepID=UPI0019589C6D|nr:DUF4062 domain-containing protein [Lentzea nigeriaca]MBM7865065.1 tetratricopeptide (TPR) repeat protein/muconolactone delta-isomerase [Lentzea nigeriaca]